MTSTIKMLSDKGVITPPQFAKETHYEVLCGSVSYGVSTDTSDVDVCALCIPPKNVIFPHLGGFITGFGTPPTGFDQYQQHHVKDPSNKDKEYDVSVFNVVKWFNLLMAGNPGLIDAMYVPDRCILHTTAIGRLIRTNRKIFLSKAAYTKFRGYAHNELHKVEHRKYENGKRKDIVESMGYDPKSLYHIRRLIGECEQLLMDGHIDLEKDNEALKSIRRGEVSPAEVREWFNHKEKQLDKLYHESTAVPHTPDEEKIKQLLIDCLEIHYGSLADILVRSDSVYKDVVSAIKKALQDGGCL